MKFLKGDYQKYVFWTIVGYGVIKAVNEPQSIQLAFSSINEFLAAIFGLIISGIIFGSIIYGISRLFKNKNNTESREQRSDKAK